MQEDTTVMSTANCPVPEGQPINNTHKKEDAELQNCSTKGNVEWPPSTVWRPSSMDRRDMSKAPIPSMDTTVAVGSRSVSALIAWATHSVPARVDNAQ